MPRNTWFTLAVVVVGLVACAPERKSAVGLWLPDGDPARGQVAFVELGCASCHTVAGLDLPRPTADPPVGVDLATLMPGRRTDGELVTSILNPSHRVAPRFAAGSMTLGGHSRMGDYGAAMTARQLIDLIAFLQVEDRSAEAGTGA